MKPVIKAFVFDAYGTLFDVHSVTKACDKWFPGKGKAISLSWRKKQLEYFFLRQLMGRYKPFDQITLSSLIYAVKEQGESLTPEQEQELLDAYKKLTAFHETEEVLKALHEKQTLVFSNGTPDMLNPLIDNAGFSPLFDGIVSVDEIKQYKPTPASYHLVLEKTGLKREEILFMSSNGWDITGAKSFGFHTAWINRNGLPAEELGFAPDKIYTDLNGILEWLD
ncbi:haloacid dehalogenase type II [Jeotgalibacillus sp. S-D1]|uniref:haloacid dehalogenase type II n=1 Tax=Jeotgalibacillus sp. S-D1 TaxID=2552189 RepID=UPI00105A074F|nr:haloacid dehalogenase type II [Jeotgalibacillus sp. S-D1]TDL30932.1 haloacid dehalogenase type II [Jeotgalibacillus sp. S-D1]